MNVYEKYYIKKRLPVKRAYEGGIYNPITTIIEVRF